jgi:hypothetical protein
MKTRITFTPPRSWLLIFGMAAMSLLFSTCRETADVNVKP